MIQWNENTSNVLMNPQRLGEIIVCKLSRDIDRWKSWTIIRLVWPVTLQYKIYLSFYLKKHFYLYLKWIYEFMYSCRWRLRTRLWWWSGTKPINSTCDKCLTLKHRRYGSSLVFDDMPSIISILFYENISPIILSIFLHFRSLIIL